MDEEPVEGPGQRGLLEQAPADPEAFVTLAAGKEMWANRHGT